MFDSAEQRRLHWYNEHKTDVKAASNSKTPDKRPHDNKRRGNELRSPHLRAVQPRRSDRLKTLHSSSKSSNPVEPEYDYYGSRDGQTRNLTEHSVSSDYNRTTSTAQWPTYTNIHQAIPIDEHEYKHKETI
jgi:hypothetical protein